MEKSNTTQSNRRIIVIEDCDLPYEEIVRRIEGKPEIIHCPCGVDVRKENLKYHKTSDRHKLYEGESNIRVEMSKVECVCGKMVRKKGLKRHMTTDDHSRRLQYRLRAV